MYYSIVEQEPEMDFDTHTFTTTVEDSTEITVTLSAREDARYDILGDRAEAVSATFEWDDGEANAVGLFRDDPAPGLYLAASHPEINGERVRTITVPDDIREAVEADIEDARANATAERTGDEQTALDKARETDTDVTIETWTEACDGSVNECSLDHVRRVATPDGEIEIRRNHAH